MALTLAQAQANLDAAREELAAAKGAQAYGMDGLNVRYRPVKELIEMVHYWESEVARLGNAGRGRLIRPLLK
jgi:hypothetical protein